MRTNPDKEKKAQEESAQEAPQQAQGGGREGNEAKGEQGGIKMPDAPKIELPKGGGAIRGMGEKFQANPVTGTGSFSVPIAMSPGRGGFTPAIGLGYNSGSGNSPYGIGWSIGLPSISRKTQKELPQYKDAEESDTFILSGAEDLIPALKEENNEWIRDEYTDGTYHVLRYRPRIEGLFARIERWFDTTSGISHWRSITPDNTTTLYGKSPNSRIADPNDATRIFQWLIEETWDDKGNAIQYVYKAEDGDGVTNSLFEANRIGAATFAQRYLKTIKYGNAIMQGATGYDTTDWLFTLVFDYGEHNSTAPTETEENTWGVRQDPFSTFRAGFEVRTWRLCQRVLMFHHFTETGGYEGIVKSTDFTYNENETATQLISVTHKSYQTGEEAESLPPLDFTYSTASQDDTLRHFDLEDLENLPMGVDGQQYIWSDLYGEGITGVLTEEPGGWFYKRNEGDESYYYDYSVSNPPEPDIRFGAQHHVASKPTFGGAQQVGDFNGDGKTELLIRSQELNGYFTLETQSTGTDYAQTAQGWSRFKHLEDVPMVNWDDPNLRLIDLNGDGIPDILISNDYCFRYYPSKQESDTSSGVEGYGERIELAPFFDEEQGPKLVFADAEQVIHMADMSGDGLTDIVRIRNGEVCYWPNLGYGRFGAKVAMPNAPHLDYPEQFSKGRIRLADMDGSGTTDLVYLGTEKVSYWNNQSGNSFSLEQEITIFPKTNNMTAVNVMDLFGKGTACLVWSSPLAGDEPYRIKYIDLFGEKPYLLKEVDNNMGALSRYHYAPSTKFYLRDRQEGNPWITKLPFPVQVVERTEQYDEVTGARFVARYAYHHGYFDHHEKEFRGFGMVEQWDTEQYENFAEDGLFQVGTNALEEESHIPPVHTKSWFHLGFWEEEGTITQHYANEYYQTDDLPDSTLPEGLNAEETRQAMRALKGQLLHTEVFADDNSALSDKPYTASSANYLVKQVQPLGANKYASFQVIPQESLSFQYERIMDDPRVSHSMVLEVNDYGVPTKNAAIAYPRLTATLDTQQSVGKITYSEAEFIHLDQDNDQYRINIPKAQRGYEVTGISLDATSLQNPEDLLTTISGADDIDYEETPSGTVEEKRLIASTKAYYYNTTCDSVLAYGNASHHGLPHHTLTLAMTEGLVDAAFNNDVTIDRVDDSLLVGTGYYTYDESMYWVSSGVMTFDTANFYSISQQTDPFGTVTSFSYDSYYMAATGSTDALGNSVAAAIDYRLLTPWQMTDPNGNRQQVGFDVLGMVTAVAVMGKDGDNDGDTLADPTQRLEYSLTNWANYGQPNYAKTEARETHGGSNWLTAYEYSGGMGQVILQKAQAEPGDAYERDDNDDLILVNGKPQLVHTDTRWVGNGRTIFNNKGKAVKQYEPYFSSIAAFEDEDEIREHGVTPVMTYDPMGRVIRTDMPDGTFTKVEFDCWQQKSYDQNDTIFDEGNAWFDSWLDRDNLPSSEPSNSNKRAIWLALKHYNTPQVADLDVLGRVYRTRDDNGTYDPATGITTNDYYDVEVELDIEGKRRTVTNQLGQATTFIYSMLPLDKEGNGVILHTDSPDGGWRRMLTNIAGNPIYAWNERGHTSRSEYDVLHRPTKAYVDEGSGELLVGHTVYGDNISGVTTPEDDNFRGQAILSFDQSGMSQLNSVDFKGNVLSATTQLAANYATTVDWTSVGDATTLTDKTNAAVLLLENDTYTSSTTFDALNRPIIMTQPNGSAYKFIYNEAALLNQVKLKLAHESEYSFIVSNINYNEKGQRTLIVYGNNARSLYYYDEFTFRLTKLVSQKRVTENSEVIKTNLMVLNYIYDPVGNIVQHNNDAEDAVYFDNAVADATRKFEYDALYRLKQATGRENNTLPIPDSSGYIPTSIPTGNTSSDTLTAYCEKFSYDELGNILELAHRSGACSDAVNWKRTYAYNSGMGDNYLQSTYFGGAAPTTAQYTYDAHGNLLTMPHLNALNWDFADQLKSTEKTDETTYYVYSGSQRVRKVCYNTATDKVKYERIYLGAHEIYREYDSSENLDLERITHHVSDDQGTVALIEVKTISGGVATDDITRTIAYRYQFTDHLDSACIEINEDQDVISYEEYYAFGATAYAMHTSDTDVSQKRYKYVHKERDDETGLYYYGARYYAAWLCRFVSVDPLKDKYPFYTTYQYAGNRPVNFIDLDGLEPAGNNTLGVGIQTQVDYPDHQGSNPPKTDIIEGSYRSPSSTSGMKYWHNGSEGNDAGWYSAEDYLNIPLVHQAVLDFAEAMGILLLPGGHLSSTYFITGGIQSESLEQLSYLNGIDVEGFMHLFQDSSVNEEISKLNLHRSGSGMAEPVYVEFDAILLIQGGASLLRGMLTRFAARESLAMTEGIFQQLEKEMVEEFSKKVTFDDLAEVPQLFFSQGSDDLAELLTGEGFEIVSDSYTGSSTVNVYTKQVKGGQWTVTENFGGGIHSGAGRNLYETPYYYKVTGPNNYTRTKIIDPSRYPTSEWIKQTSWRIIDGNTGNILKAAGQ